MAQRKAHLILPLLLVILFAGGAERAAAFEPVGSRLSDRLYSDLTYGDPGAFLAVIVYLRDDLDIYGLDSGLRLAGAGKQKRHSEVVGALLAGARESQADILRQIETAAASGEVTRYRTFWINNCIALTARGSFISALSGRDDVEWISHDRVHARRDEVERAARIAAIPNPDTLRAKSYPIRTLGLDQIWNLGLTGKGILVCVIGAGIDGNHPLLAPKWRGNNGGTTAESWFDPVNGSSFPFDDEPFAPSHDTGVTGLIVAGERTLGVAYDAQWIGAKIFDNRNLTDDGKASTKDSWLIAAFQWAVDPDGNPETVVDVPDVINNSYGTSGEFNEDICRQLVWRMIDRVEAAGTVVVFSAGNEGPEPWSTGSPASRAESPVNVFAVGSVDSTNRISPFSSRGPSACDSVSIKPTVCAPGQDIVTILGSEYGFSYQRNNGTSFSCPYVTGLVALIKQANPTLTPDEIKYLFIDTAIDYGRSGPDYAYGYGVIDPLTLFERIARPQQPILYSKRIEIDDRAGGNGNLYIEQGERIRLVVPVFNSGTLVAGVRGKLRTTSSGSRIVDDQADFGTVAQYGSSDNRNDPFLIDVLPEAEAGSQLVLYLDLASGVSSYTQTIQLSLPVAPAVQGLANHDAGSFLFSVTNIGQFGGNIGRAGAGYGLIYPKDAPYRMLYRGALLVGTSSLKVSDGIADLDFAPGPGGPIQLIENSPRADQMTVSFIAEKSAGTLNAIGVRMKQTTMVWSAAPNNDFVILEYAVANPHPATINNLYIGLYADWDIPDSLPSRNVVKYDSALKLGYIYNPIEPQFGYGGLMLVSDSPVSGHRAVSNWRYIHSGYSDNVAYAFMSGGLSRAESDSLDDWSQILASGPHSIPPGDTLVVAWALMVGDNEADLLANAAAASARYRSSLALAAEISTAGNPGAGTLPKAFSLIQNVPNPFNPSTTISYTIPQSERPLPVSLTVYDLRGRKVALLVEANQGAGSYSVTWNGTDQAGRKLPSGVYFYRLVAGDFTATRKMVIVK
ncbi:MAG: S8 family serine peptidase [Candidatus Glassbacteria bacterium]